MLKQEVRDFGRVGRIEKKRRFISVLTSYLKQGNKVSWCHMWKTPNPNKKHTRQVKVKMPLKEQITYGYISLFFPVLTGHLHGKCCC